MKFINEQDMRLSEYDDKLVRKIVKKIIVLQYDKIEIESKDGSSVVALVKL